MKLYGLILIAFHLLASHANWKTDFEQAKQEASQNHKVILLNFSGSDWCGPCIRLKKEIFESDIFDTYASKNIELVNADFPRQNKNKLSPEQARQNDSLAAVYNKNGVFPLTVLLNANGELLKKWEGFPGISPEEFVRQIKSIVDANHG